MGLIGIQSVRSSIKITIYRFTLRVILCLQGRTLKQRTCAPAPLTPAERARANDWRSNTLAVKPGDSPLRLEMPGR